MCVQADQFGVRASAILSAGTDMWGILMKEVTLDGEAGVESEQLAALWDKCATMHY